MSPSPHTSFECKNSLISTTIDDELVLLDMDSGFYFALNSVGHDIWQLLEQGKSQEEVIQQLLSEYEVTEEVCRQEVTSFLADLSKHALVTPKS